MINILKDTIDVHWCKSFGWPLPIWKQVSISSRKLLVIFNVNFIFYFFCQFFFPLDLLLTTFLNWFSKSSLLFFPSVIFQDFWSFFSTLSASPSRKYCISIILLINKCSLLSFFYSIFCLSVYFHVWRPIIDFIVEVVFYFLNHLYYLQVVCLYRSLSFLLVVFLKCLVVFGYPVMFHSEALKEEIKAVDGRG